MAASAEAPGAFVARVAATIRRYDVFGPGESVVAAVSGGADSLCLLHSLHAMAPALGLRLHVAHVQHGLRGAAAAADAAFVAGEAARLGLPYSLLPVDVEALRRAGYASVEDAARRARYAALRARAREIDATCIATGHSEDDQAETLLLHLLRGSGIDGLAAMRPRRGDLARPLLERSRAEIDAYCRACGLHPRQDETNASRAYRRNQIRLDLLPRLERYNPRAREALARSARTLARDAAYLHAQAAEALELLLCDATTTEAWETRFVELDRHGYRELHEGLRPHVLRAAIERLTGSMARFTAEHLEAIDALACGPSAGQLRQFPGQVWVEAGQTLSFAVGARSQIGGVAAPPTVHLPVPGEARFGAWILRTTRYALGADPSGAAPWRVDEGDRHVAWGDAAAVGAPLVVRGRAPGDRLRPLGLGGAKKVQDLLVDRRIPRSRRDAVPIVVGPHGIVWVAGCALDEHARLGAGSVEAIRIEAAQMDWEAVTDRVDA